MNDYTCSVEDCARPPVNVRGWCNAHYHHWRRYGDPLGGGRRYATAGESFAVRTAWRGECIEWTAHKSRTGYGKITVNGSQKLAHRYAWEMENGPIPDEMWIDHICHNRACVRIEHLRLVTPAQNNRYREGATVKSSSGVRNVYRRGNGKFRVTLGVGGKLLHFGTYETMEEAALVAEAKRGELFGEFAGGN